MNILIVSQYFWPENFRINDIATGLKKSGHNVTVLTGKPNYPEGHFFEGYSFFKKKKEYYNGINILRVPLIPRGNGSGLRLILNYLSFAILGSIIGPFICRKKYDVIFVFEVSPITVGFPAIVMKRIKKAPIFFWVLDLWPESLSSSGNIKSKKILNLVRVFVRFIYSNCDKILVSSKGFIKNIEVNYSLSKPVEYFPNFVEEIEIDEKRHVDYDFPKGFNIVFAGNIGESQSFPTIIDAAEKLSNIDDINWIILGAGRMYKWVKNEIRKRKLEKNFNLLGLYPSYSMPFFYSEADTLLVSLKKEPNFELTVPGKVQSYLAAGKPIIASLDGEGASIINESGAGIACPAEDSDSLADAVMKIYRMDEIERNGLGEKGLKYCEKHFNREKLIRELEVMMIKKMNG